MLSVLSRTLQIACMSFFMIVANEGQASLADHFKDLTLYSLMPLLFIASSSGFPASNITVVDLKNKTITDFDLPSNDTTTLNLNTNDETLASLKEQFSVLQRQLYSLQMKQNNETSQEKDRENEIAYLRRELKALQSRAFGIGSTSLVIVSVVYGVVIFFVCQGLVNLSNRINQLGGRFLLLERPGT